jgi:hypothetical protein
MSFLTLSVSVGAGIEFISTLISYFYSSLSSPGVLPPGSALEPASKAPEITYEAVSITILCSINVF